MAAIDSTEQATTATAWLERLDKVLCDRQPALALIEDYYCGRHRLQFATSKFRQTFGSLFAAFADNWCALVADAAVERLRIEGFRFGLDQGADQAAWGIWQANQLDAGSLIAHTEAVKHGVAYAMVEPPRPNSSDPPRITIEHPAQVAIAYADGDRSRRVAAVKKWHEDGYVRANLYLPELILKFRSSKPTTEHSGEVTWESLAGDAEGVNALGVVPVVALENNPSMLGGGQSDIAPVIDLQNAINKLATDMIVASEYAAFKQRWATGIDIPGADPDTGEPLGGDRTEQFLSSISRVWAVESENAKFGEFAESDLNNYVKAIEMLIQHVAAQTRTPPHYLLGSAGSFPSGESLKATETGLVAKVRRKQLSFGEGWEEVMRLAFKALGDTSRADATAAETIWMDPEARTEGERVDALLKMSQLGVPQEALWERWGATQEEIARWKTMREQQPVRPTQLVIGDNPTAPASGTGNS